MSAVMVMVGAVARELASGACVRACVRRAGGRRPARPVRSRSVPCHLRWVRRKATTRAAGRRSGSSDSASSRRYV